MADHGSSVRLPARRSGRAPPPDLIGRREGMAALAGQPRPLGVDIGFADIAGVSCAVCTPQAPRGKAVHFHGGGYRLGAAAAWAPFGARLAAACGLQVLVPDYALAPEHPFPAALHDAVAVVEALAESDAGGPLVLSGDSAGGGLALSCALAAGAAGHMIDGLLLLSPWLDLTVTAATYQTCATTDQLFSHAAATEAAEAYLQGVAPRDPLASPLFGDLALTPPTLVLASAGEVLLQDSLALASGLAAVGRYVQLHVVPDQPHVWPVLQPDTPASGRALQAAAAFVAHQLGHAPNRAASAALGAHPRNR